MGQSPVPPRPRQPGGLLSRADRHLGGPSRASTPASSHGWPDTLAETTNAGRFVAKHPSHR
jgi:hypothetical protein